MIVVAGVTSLLFSKLRLPAVIGYLVAGVILGPYTPPFSLVKNIDSINIMASLGVVLLMFSIGLDFNLKRLRKVGLFAVIAGAVEIALMVTIGYALGNWFGWSSLEALFLGAVMSFSSTAMIIKVLTDTGSLRKDHAEAIIGILIIEDFAAVIVLTLAAPLTSGVAIEAGQILEVLMRIVFFVGISLVLGIAVIPKAIDLVRKRYSDETLLLVSLGLCFGMSVISLALGLSVAIGAFIMGIVISQSNSVERVNVKIIPLKEVFLAIFFVSIGMLIDPALVFANIGAAIIVAVVFIAGKTLSVTFASYVSNLDARTSFMTGMGMVAIGEFSFVIAKVGADTQAVGSFFYSTVIGAAIMTMIVLPFSVKYSPKVLDAVSLHLPQSIKNAFALIERLRASVRERLSMSTENRKELKTQITWVFIEFTFIFIVAIVADFIYYFTDFVAGQAQNSRLLPALLLGGVSVALMLPAIIGIIRRMRRIAALLVRMTLESGNFNAAGGKLIYTIFMSLFTVFVAIIMLSLMISLIPATKNVAYLPPVAIIIVGALVAYLLWKVTKSAHSRMADVLSKGIMNDEEENR
ncbi:MAG: cation:proton antiporter [Methanomassiliicoccales archaeon]|nr:cation:proton antiporter [Methanomassiliicoccales archaeon]